MTRRRLGALALRAVAAYLGLVLLLWGFQRRLLYVGAGRADVVPPEDARLLTEEAVDHVPVHALELLGPGARKVVVFFHGNGEVVGDDVGLARALVRSGFHVVLVEYRGYGHSSPGDPTEAGLYADAEAVLDALSVRGFDASRVVLWGASLGTGVAAEMAARGRGAALVLVSPYTSMGDVAAAHFPWLPARLLVRDRFDTLGKAPRIKVPTIVLHGSLDEVVPLAMGEQVAKGIAGARFVRVEGGHHNDLFADRGASPLPELAAFARAATAPR